MKATISETTVFTPITIAITLESQQDVNAFYAITNYNAEDKYNNSLGLDMARTDVSVMNSTLFKLVADLSTRKES